MTNKTRTATAIFALDGLTCGVCSETVNSAIKAFQPSLPPSSNNDNDADTFTPPITITKVNVSLFPDSKLTLSYTYPTQSNKDSDADLNAAFLEEIIECIENIGFGAEIVSIDNIGEGDVENKGGNENVIKTFYLDVERNVKMVVEFLKKEECIHSVEEGKEGGSNSGTIKVTYDPHVIGIRTILASIRSHCAAQSTSTNDHAQSTVETAANKCGSLKVTDAASYQNMLDQSDGRRQAEIQQYKRSFLFAAAFAIPVAFISMIFVHVPGTKTFLHSKSFCKLLLPCLDPLVVPTYFSYTRIIYSDILLSCIV